MRIAVNGVRLFVDVEGTSLVPDGPIMRERPTIVLLHGGPGNDHAVFRPFMSFLAERAQLIYFDYRGHGRSDIGRPEDWNLRQWGDDVVGLLDALGLDRPMVLGASAGSFVAQSFATRHPDRVSKLALVSSAPRTSTDLSVETFTRLGGEEVSAIARRFLSGDASAAPDYMQRCLPYYMVDELDLTDLVRSIDTPEVRNHFFAPDGEWHTMDFRPTLDRIRCPTLILNGELDPILPVALARELYDALPPGLGKLHVVRNAAHGWGDQPEEWRSALRTFFFG